MCVVYHHINVYVMINYKQNISINIMNFPFFPAVVKITGILYDSLTFSLKQPPNVTLKTCRHGSAMCAHPHLSELG